MRQHTFRYVLLVSAGLLFLSTSLILVIILISPNVLKPAIEQWVKANKQRTLTIRGDLQIDFFPRIFIQINDLTLSEYQHDQQQFAAIEQIQIAPIIGLLLDKQFVIDYLVVEGLSVRLIRDPHGAMNIDDLLKQSDEAVSFTVEIAQTKIIDSQLLIQDDMTQQQILFEAINLTGDRLASESVERVTLHTPIQVIGVDNNQEHFAMRLEASDLLFDQAGTIGGYVTLSVQSKASDRHLSLNISATSGVQSDQSDKSGPQAQVQGKLNAEDDVQTVQINLDTILAMQSDGQRWRFYDLETNAMLFRPHDMRKPLRGRLSGEIIVDMSSNLLQTELHGLFANSPLAVFAKMDMSPETRLHFDIKLDQLDLNEWLTEQMLQSEKSEITRYVEPSEQTMTLPDFSFLDALNLNGSIQIGALSVDQARLSGLQIMFTPEGNSLDLNQSIQ